MVRIRKSFEVPAAIALLSQHKKSLQTSGVLEINSIPNKENGTIMYNQAFKNLNGNGTKTRREIIIFGKILYSGKITP